MTRRTTLVRLAAAALAAAGAAAASAQQPPANARVGLVVSAVEPSRIAAFRDGLREAGWVEGRNLALEMRSADGAPARGPALVAELVARNVDVLVVSSGALAMAAKQASATMPVVFATVIDPVASGLVASLARPAAT